ILPDGIRGDWRTAKSVVPLERTHVVVIPINTLFPKRGRGTMLTTEELSAVTPADWVPGPLQGSWTYNDYATLPDDGRRYEIMNGVLVMAPAPNPDHQSIAMRLS